MMSEQHEIDRPGASRAVNVLLVSMHTVRAGALGRECSLYSCF